MFNKPTVEPADVFTPRGPYDPKHSVYVERAGLEEALGRALKSRIHILVYGESGCGKSWLVRKTLDASDAGYEVVNLALARSSSIDSVFSDCLRKYVPDDLSSYEDTKSAKGSVGVAGAELTNVRTYERNQRSSYIRLLQALSKRGKRYLVLENFEAIADVANRRDELASYMLLLDDPECASYNVQFVLIGIPNLVREYFGQAENQQSIANRTRELPEVGRLTLEEAQLLVEEGFKTRLGYRFPVDEEVEIIRHIAFITFRIPQALQEYCLILGQLAAATRTVSKTSLNEADKQWFSESMQSQASQIEKVLNRRATEIGRRNQLLYVLGQTDLEEFKGLDLERAFREAFPNTTRGKSLNLQQVLSSLADEPAILRRSVVDPNVCMFKHPATRLALRLLLAKSPSESIEKRF